MKLLNEKCTQELRRCTGNADILPLYVYDNVALQKGAQLSDIGLAWHQHVTTPAHSPDFNKPIEHCWNHIKRQLLNRIYSSYDVELTPALAQQWVGEAWESITVASVDKDVKSLKDTWAIIKADLGVEVVTSKNEKIQGSGGDYPPSSTYR